MQRALLILAFALGSTFGSEATRTFECTGVTRPSSIVICSDPDLMRIADARQEQTRECVKIAYEGQTAQWLSRLSGPAYEEATRPAERHVELQRSLGVLGFLLPAIRADGVYGDPTRNAIMVWQTGHGRAATGFIGDSDARGIQREALRIVPSPELEPPSGPQEEIPLLRHGGVFVIPVRINDAITLRFILDTGASDVFIPVDVARTIDRTGTIVDSDMLGTSICKLADGSERKCQTFRLRELRLGNHVVRNVVASVGPSESDLLLGQTFLSRLGLWAIDNARNVLILQKPATEPPSVSGTQR